MIRLRTLAVVASTALLAGCSVHTPPRTNPVDAPIMAGPMTSAPGQPVTIPSPSQAIIDAAGHAFDAGQADLAIGHLVAAREHFDQALDLVLTAPGGARATPDLEAEYERLLDRTTALETQALRDGDGFTEAHSSPAVIDQLLADSTNPPAPATNTAERVHTDLETNARDLPIAMNDRVLSYVELFEGPEHDFMQETLDRSLRYVPMIEDVFGREHLPLDLAYLPIVESAFKPTALSVAAAKGLWQFEADTGAENGLSLNWFLDDRSDPEKATQAAAQYLKALLGEFNGDWDMTLAAYNAGPGRVEQAEKRGKTTDFWTLSASSKYLPRDTREYVPMVLASILIATNPSLYGFDVAALSPLTYERVTVPDAIDLRVVAEWTGVSVDEIRQLNPELRRTMTPRGQHELKVPMGTAATVEARLATADPSVFVDFKTYQVKSGESLAGIARRFKVRTADLAQANQLKTSSKLKAGQTLIIPRDPAATASLISAPATPTATAKATARAAPTTYRVKSGDTLSSIARQFDTTVADLKRLNQLSTDVIVVGDRLTVKR